MRPCFLFSYIKHNKKNKVRKHKNILTKQKLLYIIYKYIIIKKNKKYFKKSIDFYFVVCYTYIKLKVRHKKHKKTWRKKKW